MLGRAAPPQPVPGGFERTTSGSSHWHTLVAPSTWQTVDLISDLHLNVSEPETANAFFLHLAHTTCSALMILGDLFEVWVGDDLPQAHTAQDHPEAAFNRRCCEALAQATQRFPIYVMHGNRDFLLGSAFFKATQITWLPDPTMVQGPKGALLLTHGDAWCLDDHDYQAFRQQVRQSAWQHDFLGLPRSQREAVARQLRQQSEALKAASRGTEHAPVGYADVDTPTADHWLDLTGAKRLVHGHTHRPAVHPLKKGRERWVLSDWDARALPQRLEVLNWDLPSDSLTRVPAANGHNSAS